MTRLATILAAGELDHYDRRPPLGRAERDRERCEQSTCPDCCYTGLLYMPFTREQPSAYRAFAVCPCCGYTVEL
jgi:hypothetical protein